MRSLLLHANVFESRITQAGTRPADLVHEDPAHPDKRMEECLLVLFCVEAADTDHQLRQLYQEIIASAENVKTTNIMVAPFVHLSKTIARPPIAMAMYQQLMERLKTTSFTVDSSHFGYHKELLFDIKGHQCAYKLESFELEVWSF